MAALAAPLHAQQLDSATALLHHGRYSEGIAALQRATRSAPTASAPARALVRALAEVGRYDEAEREARRFVAARPGSPELWTALGDVLAAVGRRAAAESAFSAAVARRASDSLTARLDLALLKEQRGDLAGARRDFDGFIDIYNNRKASLTASELTAVGTAVRHLAATNPELAKDALRAYDEAGALDSLSVEPRLAAGALLLERYNETDARATFEAILQQNPNQPRALVGLAQCLRFEGTGDAAQQARLALAVNPNMVEAHVFLAEWFVDLEDYSQARGEVRRALAVNPEAQDALAARAATEYLSGDTTAYVATVRQVLALNPADAALYTTLANVGARNRRYADAAAFAAKGVALDSTAWHAYSLLGINQLRAGQMDSGRVNLEAAFRGDPYDVWTKNTLDLLDQLDRYTATHSRRFTFVMDGKEAPVLSLYYGKLAEEAYDSLAARYDYAPATPIRVEVFPHEADFSVRTVGLVGLGALGVSFGNVVVMDSPSSQDAGAFSWGSALWHELSHTFHLGMTAHRVPRWFTEGLAVYEERRARPGWGDGVTPGFLAAFNQGRLHAVSDLNEGFVRPDYPAQLLYSYYEASLVLEMIEREHGTQALLAMLAGYKRGETTPQIFGEVLHADAKAVDQHFGAYLKTKFAGPLAAVGTPDTAPQRVVPDDMTRLARDTTDYFAQAGMGGWLLQQHQPAQALPYLQRAKALFPEYADAGSPRWMLAQAFAAMQDTVKALGELRQLTARNSQIYPALLLQADLLAATGDTAGAAAALDKAMYVWPLDVAVHRRLAALAETLHDWPVTVRERHAVVDLEPVDHAEAWYQLARAYQLSGDKAEARRAVLKALELAPNFPAAQDLLLSLTGG